MGTSSDNKPILNKAIYLRMGLPLVALAGLFLFQNCSSRHENINDLTQQSVVSDPNPLILEDQAKENTPFRMTLPAADISTGTEYYWTALYLSGPACTQSLSTDGSIATFTCSQLRAVVVNLVATATDGTMNTYNMNIMVGDGTTGTPPTPLPG